MRFLSLLLAAGLVASAFPAEAGLQRMRDQDRAYRAMQEGRILSLPEILARVRVPGARYIGAEVIGEHVYRLKFIRSNGAQVIWIDVDARTGRIVGRH